MLTGIPVLGQREVGVAFEKGWLLRQGHEYTMPFECVCVDRVSLARQEHKTQMPVFSIGESKWTTHRRVPSLSAQRSRVPRRRASGVRCNAPLAGGTLRSLPQQLRELGWELPEPTALAHNIPGHRLPAIDGPSITMARLARNPLRAHPRLEE